MSMQSAREYIKRLQKDTAFREKLRGTKATDRPAAIGAAGFDFDKDEMAKALEELGISPEQPDVQGQGQTAIVDVICCGNIYTNSGYKNKT